MRMSTAFPSKYLSASDLQGRTFTLNIQQIKEEDVGDGNKPIVYFQGASKGLVLNKTNAMTIVGIYGDDSDAWIGRPIELFSMKVQYQGQLVDGLRVRIPSAPLAGAHNPQQPASQPVTPVQQQPAQQPAGPLPDMPPAAAPMPTGMPQPTGAGQMTDDELNDEVPF